MDKYMQAAKELKTELETYAANLQLAIEDATQTSPSPTDPMFPKELLWAALGGMITNLTLRVRETCPSSALLLQSTATLLGMDPSSVNYNLTRADIAGAASMASIMVMMRRHMDALENNAVKDAKQELSRIMRIHPDRPGPR